MSIIDLPRIYFDGHFHWNPSTFNNNDYIDTYNPAMGKLNKAWLQERGVYTKEQFRKWAIEAQVVGGDTVTPPSEWNFHGGMQAGFLSKDSPNITNPDFNRPDGGTLTSGFTGTGGGYNTKDPWIGKQIQYNIGTVPAKLIDVDPTAFWSSQFFADSFQLGSKDEGEGFSAPCKYRSHSRWINLMRNYNTTGEIMIAGGISCVWQTCFHTEDLTWFNSSPKKGTFQAQLQSALQGDQIQGLMLRYLTYDTVYFQGDVFENLPAGNVNERMVRVARLFQQYAADLEAYEQGKTNQKPQIPINRAYSKVVGWLGLWKEGELASMPGGRMLFPGADMVEASGLPESYYFPNDTGSIAAQVMLAPTAVEVEYSADGSSVERIAVDMGSTMPEVQYSGEKADFGQVQLIMETPDNPDGLVIANLPNDQATYLKTAGVVNIPKKDFINTPDADALRTSCLGITVESFVMKTGSTERHETPEGTTERVLALIEKPFTAQTDQRGVYANQPNPSWDDNAENPTFTVQVRYFGGPPPKGTRIAFAQYSPVPLMVGSGAWAIVREGSSKLQDPFVNLYVPGKKRNKNIGRKTLIDVPASGEVTLHAEALRPGFGNIAFYPVAPGETYAGPKKKFASPEITSAYYCVVRSLPFDNIMALDFENWLKSRPDTQHLPDVQLVNQRVFDDVYGTYALMYPVMDFISNPMKFQEYRGRILMVTDPKLFDSAMYMPATRNLSAGQRRILELWDEYLNGMRVGSKHNKSKPKPKQIR